jgi:hypothetical protein
VFPLFCPPPVCGSAHCGYIITFIHLIRFVRRASEDIWQVSTYGRSACHCLLSLYSTFLTVRLAVRCCASGLREHEPSDDRCPCRLLLNVGQRGRVTRSPAVLNNRWNINASTDIKVASYSINLSANKRIILIKWTTNKLHAIQCFLRLHMALIISRVPSSGL